MDCIFCKIANKELPSKILYEDDLVLVIMDAYPHVDGHCLIIPKKHYTDYQELDAKIITHIFEIAKTKGKDIQEKLQAKSLSLLINYGESQMVKHFHLHLLPEFTPPSTNNCTKSIEENFNLLAN